MTHCSMSGCSYHGATCLLPVVEHWPERSGALMHRQPEIDPRRVIHLKKLNNSDQSMSDGEITIDKIMLIVKLINNQLLNPSVVRHANVSQFHSSRVMNEIPVTYYEI